MTYNLISCDLRKFLHIDNHQSQINVQKCTTNICALGPFICYHATVCQTNQPNTLVYVICIYIQHTLCLLLLTLA